MLRQLRQDVGVVMERDPAVKSSLEVVLCYPGVHSLVMHRVAHWFYRRRLFVLARFLSQVSRFFTQIEIHPGAQIGQGFFIDHGAGVVIGETAEVGDNVTLYQGVTLGGTGKEKGKRHPTIGDDVVIGTGAKVLGSISIGQGVKIGAGSVVVHPVPDECTVVGVPARIVKRRGERLGTDLDHGQLPDPVYEALEQLQGEMARLKAQLEEMADQRQKEKEHRTA